MKKKTKKLEKFISILIVAIIAIIGSYFNSKEEQTENKLINDIQASYELSNIPDYNGEICVKINNDIPKFTTKDMAIEKDYYTELKDGKVRNGNDKN